MIPHIDVIIVQDGKEHRFTFKGKNITTDEYKAEHFTGQYHWNGDDPEKAAIRVWGTYSMSDEERERLVQEKKILSIKY